jgi:hypothetical protein
VSIQILVEERMQERKKILIQDWAVGNGILDELYAPSKS